MPASQSDSTNDKVFTMRLLLLLPFIALLWIPFYNRELPDLFSFPFFYWYQLLWVPLTAGIIWIVFRFEARHGVDVDEAGVEQ